MTDRLGSEAPAMQKPTRTTDALGDVQDWRARFRSLGPGMMFESEDGDERLYLGSVERIDRLVDEFERLRGLLARLEWAGGDSGSCCPSCGVRWIGDQQYDDGERPHTPTCWLAEALGARRG